MSYTQSTYGGAFGSELGSTFDPECGPNQYKDPILDICLNLTEQDICNNKEGFQWDTALQSCEPVTSEIMPWDVPASTSDPTAPAPNGSSGSSGSSRTRLSPARSGNGSPPPQGLATWQKYAIGITSAAVIFGMYRYVRSQ
jgi:hypothetical protein